MSKEDCYACGFPMAKIQTFKFRLPNCGALLDREDMPGLPK